MILHPILLLLSVPHASCLPRRGGCGPECQAWSARDREWVGPRGCGLSQSQMGTGWGQALLGAQGVLHRACQGIWALTLRLRRVFWGPLSTSMPWPGPPPQKHHSQGFPPTHHDSASLLMERRALLHAVK